MVLGGTGALNTGLTVLGVGGLGSTGMLKDTGDGTAALCAACTGVLTTVDLSEAKTIDEMDSCGDAGWLGSKSRRASGMMSVLS